MFDKFILIGIFFFMVQLRDGQYPMSKLVHWIFINATVFEIIFSVLRVDGPNFGFCREAWFHKHSSFSSLFKGYFKHLLIKIIPIFSKKRIVTVINITVVVVLMIFPMISELYLTNCHTDVLIEILILPKFVQTGL